MPAGPEWEELYHQALLELDEGKMAELIVKAKQAVHKRLSDIRSNSKAVVEYEERHKLEDALISLECLRRISQGSAK
jgi:hypothetical protein